MAAPGHITKAKKDMEDWVQSVPGPDQNPEDEKISPKLSVSFTNQVVNIFKEQGLDINPSCKLNPHDFGFAGRITIDDLWENSTGYNPLIIEWSARDFGELCETMLKEAKKEAETFKRAKRAFEKCQKVWQDYGGSPFRNYSWALEDKYIVRVRADYTDKEGRECSRVVKEGWDNGCRRNALRFFWERVDENAKFAEKQKAIAEGNPESTEKGESSTQEQASTQSQV